MAEDIVKTVLIVSFVASMLYAMGANAQDWRPFDCDCDTRDDWMPRDSYIVPRPDGGYTEVYPGRGSVTVTPEGPLGVINVYRRGLLPPSQY